MFQLELLVNSFFRESIMSVWLGSSITSRIIIIVNSTESGYFLRLKIEILSLELNHSYFLIRLVPYQEFQHVKTLQFQIKIVILRSFSRK